jgi:molecular chaperone Hsp33
MTQPTQVPESDALLRFLLEASGVRGVLVRLTETWRAVLERTAYPPAVAVCLGETLAATALMTGHAKVDGRLSVQLRGTGAFRSMFAECTRDGTIRGLAGFSEPLPDVLGPRDFGADSVLAITIENVAIGDRPGMRYQGLVELDADSMAEAFEDYFAQSEQLPTRMLLAADASSAVGLMLQKLPDSVADADGWPRAVASFETLGREELLATRPHDLLFRLFHEDNVRVRDARPLRFGCSCSRERVASMLQSLGRAEALAAVQDSNNDSRPPAATVEAGSTVGDSNGSANDSKRMRAAEVSCAFCGQTYRLAEDEVLELFESPPPAPAPDTLQ